jgi:hypothetical protein
MIVYLLTNQVNGKVYIGQHTGFRLEKRWNKTFSGRNKANPHLAAAFRKYGADNFTRTILCYATCQEELNLLEKFWIAFFQSSNNKFGYNKTLGGQPAVRFNKASRAAISKAGRLAWRRGAHPNHGAIVSQWWRDLSDAERRLIRLRQSMALRGRKVRNPTSPWNKGLRGIPSGRKGRKFGPQKNPCRHFPAFSEKHKKRISQALKRYHRKRRRFEKG